ncbi:MAG: hypothetical protein CMN30_03545 [Sandaracinus sp.]|nr:hypothetical protein [Sandaracinus sp.]
MIVAIKIVAAIVALLVVFDALWRWARRRHQLPSPTWLAWVLGGSLADWFLGTDTALDRMGLRAGFDILEIGPGPGRLRVPVAQRFGPTGRAVGLDIQEGIAERLRERAARKDVTNLQGVVGKGSEACFPAESFDLVFIALTPGEIPAREDTLRHCREVLRPGGRFSVTELSPDPHFLSRRKASELAQEPRFEHEVMQGHALFFTTNFLKPSRVSS